MTVDWTRLGIAPTEDIREIKRAYAKKLKVTRPEESPQAFQALHEAYKSAVYFVEEGKGDVNDDPQDESLEEPSENIRVEAIDSSVQSSEELDLHQDAEFVELVEKMEALLKEGSYVGYVKHWEFFSLSSRMLEDDFNYALSLVVFKRVAQYILHPTRSARDFPIQISVESLHYLDGLFGWQDMAYVLYELVDEQAFNKIFIALDTEPQKLSPKEQIRGGKILHASAEKKAQPNKQARSNGGGNYWIWFLGAYLIFKLIQVAVLPILCHYGIVILSLGGIEMEKLSMFGCFMTILSISEYWVSL